LLVLGLIWNGRACDENNLVHSERFRVYKEHIWAVKTKFLESLLLSDSSTGLNAVP